METFERNGLRFDVVDSGPPDGEPVVLLHGFPQDASSWAAVSSALNEAGYRTLAPDQRGYSPSARPTHPRDYSDRHLVDDLWALLEAAGVSAAHVVGHDWGAVVAWAAASDRPDRVLTLSAFSVPHPAALMNAMRRGQAFQSWYIAMLLVPGLAERLIRPGSGRWGHLMRGLPPDQAARYTERMAQPGAFTAALNWYRAIPGHIRRPGVRVGPVTAPTLFAWGSADPTTSPAAAHATRQYVRAAYTYRVLDGGTHWLPETRPTEVADLLLHHIMGSPDDPHDTDPHSGG